MKVIQLKLYTFKELGRVAKQKALTDYRYLNVDFNWWDDIYGDFISLCEYLAITVEKDSIKFSGFYSQGDGSAFSAKADLIRLNHAITAQAWKAYAPLQEFKFPALTADRRVLRLVDSGLLPSEPQIIARYRQHGVTADIGAYVVNENRDHDNVFEELDKLDEWLKAVAQILNRFLYESLQNQYEFLTADSTVKESLLFNEYLFTADGRAAGHLLELAKHHNTTK